MGVRSAHSQSWPRRPADDTVAAGQHRCPHKPAGPRDLQTAASRRPSHAVLGGGLEPEVIPPKLPGCVLSPSPFPQSQHISLLVPLVTDAPPLRRLSWAMARRTCISLATAWVRNWQRRPAGGWGAEWAGSQVGTQGDVGWGRRGREDNPARGVIVIIPTFQVQGEQAL